MLSKAKIEVMCLDLPRVEYLKTDKDGNVLKSKKESSYDEVADKNNQLLEKMKAKKVAKDYIGEKISLKEILEG